MNPYMRNNNKSNGATGGGGIGFVSLLQLCFIVLKLCDVIEWSWLWVLAPTWISILLLILFIIILIKIFKR